MMRIADPHLLWLLLAAPAVVLAYAIAFARRRRSLKRLGEPALIARMAASVSVRAGGGCGPVVLAVAFLALALARPQAVGTHVWKQRGSTLWWRWIFPSPCWPRTSIPRAWSAPSASWKG